MLPDGAPAQLVDRADGSGPIAQDLFWIFPWRSWAALRTGGAAQISRICKSRWTAYYTADRNQAGLCVLPLAIGDYAD